MASLPDHPPAPGPCAKDQRVNIVRVDECAGHCWYASPRRRTIYYLGSLPPLEAAEAVSQALAALIAAERVPKLRLVPPLTDDGKARTCH